MFNSSKKQKTSTRKTSNARGPNREFNNASRNMRDMLDVSGRPNTRDYGKALEALKLLTENVLRGPHNRVMGTT
jgi:hypothetical protein